VDAILTPDLERLLQQLLGIIQLTILQGRASDASTQNPRHTSGFCGLHAGGQSGRHAVAIGSRPGDPGDALGSDEQFLRGRLYLGVPLHLPEPY
jgi:hypothetical protein